MDSRDLPLGFTDWSAIPRIEHAGETGTAYWRAQVFGELRAAVDRRPAQRPAHLRADALPQP